MRAKHWSALLALAVLLSGCLERELKPLNPCTISGVKEVVKVSNVDNVDLLFVIDNSLSMADEQQSLRDELPKLVQVLTTGDLNADGMQDFAPVKSLHVGVVTTDMGIGNNTIDGCTSPDGLGDNGVLRTTSEDGACGGNYPKFLEFSPGAAGNAQATTDFECLAIQGTGGCGFEQQLESALKAVTPSTSETVTFYNNSPGQADMGNAGFLRDDSLLAIIMATDEEDCSSSNPDELFNLASTVYQEQNANLRCYKFPQALHPVQRFVDGLLASRADKDLFVFAGIVGIPVQTQDGMEWDGLEFDAMLAHPDMQETIDPNLNDRLLPSCDNERGKAYPPRRIVELAKGLNDAESNALIQSICQASYANAINAILEKIADVLGGACLPRELVPNSEGIVNCDVVETLPAGTSCSQVPGREGIATEGDGREICRVNQLAVQGTTVADGNGWYYDNFTDDVLKTCAKEASAQRIAFATGSEPITGTEVDLQCLQQINSTDVQNITLGSGCTPRNPGDPNAPYDMDQGNATCDPDYNTWQYSCGSDAECESADLKGWRCWTDRPCSDPNDQDGCDQPVPKICINPTCSQG